jgi:hypothetical protein
MKFKPLERGSILLSRSENRIRKFGTIQMLEGFKGDHPRVKVQEFDCEAKLHLSRAR